jgi:2,4-dienoyl-CoA reductase-like NADH-dependent reductase (Old Yellow Enzyme family)
MNVLFEPAKIKNMELRNRFVRSATYDACAQGSGQVSDRQIKLFADLAAGGVGLIVTGITYVHQSGQNLAFQNAIAGEDFIPGLKRLTAVVHDRGAKVAVQLFHAGRERARFLEDKNKQAMAPSFVYDDPYFTAEYRTMTEEEICQNKEADFISLCRPFIREPGIVNHWKRGDRHRAKCISCNKCLEAVREGETLHCVQQKFEDKRQT